MKATGNTVAQGTWAASPGCNCLARSYEVAPCHRIYEKNRNIGTFYSKNRNTKNIGNYMKLDYDSKNRKKRNLISEFQKLKKKGKVSTQVFSKASGAAASTPGQGDIQLNQVHHWWPCAAGQWSLDHQLKVCEFLSRIRCLRRRMKLMKLMNLMKWFVWLSWMLILLSCSLCISLLCDAHVLVSSSWVQRAAFENTKVAT